MAIFDEVIELIATDIEALPEESVSVRERWREKRAVSVPATLKAFAPPTVAMLRQVIAPLMQWRNIRGFGDAYALDLLMARAQIAVLRRSADVADLRIELFDRLSALQMHLKSTILQSLHYLREILERRNADPDQTIAGGLIDLGGFATLVHGHDLSQTIVIKVEIDGVDGHGSERLPLNSGASLTAAEFEALPIRYLVGENTDLKEYAVVQSIGVSLSISWSALLTGPYVSAITVMLDGADIGTITSPPQSGQAILSKFNFDHPLFRRFRDADEPLEPDEEFSPYPLADEILDLSRQMSKSDDVQLHDYRVGVETFLGALPDLGRPMVSDLRDPEVKKFELESRTPRVRGLNALLDELIVGPLRLVHRV